MVNKPLIIKDGAMRADINDNVLKSYYEAISAFESNTVEFWLVENTKTGEKFAGPKAEVFSKWFTWQKEVPRVCLLTTKLDTEVAKVLYGC